MLQKDRLLEWRTIYNNVMFGLEVKHIKTKENIWNVNTEQEYHEEAKK